MRSVCPSDLLERLNALSESERHRLSEHAAECPACALELRLPARVRSTEHSVDPALLAGAISAATRELTAQAPARRPIRLQHVVVGALVLAGAFAAVHEWSSRRGTNAGAEHAGGNVSVGSGPRVSDPMPEPEAERASSPIPTEPPLMPEAPATPSIQAAPPPPAPRVAPAYEEDEGAAPLFARANDARQQGDTSRALALYRKLARKYPMSEEAAVAHVSAGRLLLDVEGNAAAALSELDTYLADPRRTVLRESSLIGRARALGMLGRPDDERRAWEALLAEYPSSLSAGRARARLAALR